MLSDEEINIYELAFCLGGISVYDLLARPWDEVMGWFNYFDRRPYQWRDDDRTFKHLQTQGAKDKPWAYFSSLQPIYNPPAAKLEGRISTRNLKGSLMFQKMLAAKGGDKLEVLIDKNDSPGNQRDLPPATAGR